MEAVCETCQLQCDAGARVARLLTCGHTTCYTCLDERAADDGKTCTICGKVFKANRDQFDQDPLKEKKTAGTECTLWCTLCDSLQQETAVLEEEREQLQEAQAAVAKKVAELYEAEVKLEAQTASFVEKETALLQEQSVLRGKRKKADAVREQAARQNPPAPSAPADPSAPGIDSLPDELLLLVLALLPAPHAPRWKWERAGDSVDAQWLLRLRLVCRRWSRLVLDAAVWRHRKLTVRSYDSPAQRMALHAVPVLRQLDVSRAGDQTRAVLETLAVSKCQIPCLTVATNVSKLSVGLVCTILKRNGPVLRELRLSLRVVHRLSDPSPIMSRVNRLQNLQRLTLDMSSSLYVDAPTLGYRFSRLRSLKALTLGRGLEMSLIKSLLVANRDNLLDLDCGDHDLFRKLSRWCPSLGSLTAVATDSMASLADLSRLDRLVIDVRTPAHALLLQDVLDGPALSRTALHVLATVREDGAFDEVAQLSPRSLRLRCSGVTAEGFAHCLQHMADLEELHIHFDIWSPGKLLSAIVARWPRGALPALRALHLGGSVPWESRRALSAALRPGARLCVSCTCGEDSVLTNLQAGS